MQRLSRDELQGVVAHEFSHILNGDMRLNLRLIGLIHGLGAEDAARLGAAMGALATTTIDTFSGPDDPADAWRLAGLEPPA